MRKRISDERGQSMVLITLAMVGLIAFLALVIDGGMVFAERRHMQNAADAGALAGVRAFFGRYNPRPWDGDDEQAIYDAVIQYAQDNGVQDPASNLVAYFIDEDLNPLPIASPRPIGTEPLGIPADALGVEVTTSTDFPSFFATVIGRDKLGASALAAAILVKEGCVGPYVLWADSPWCPAGNVLQWAGSVGIIGGSIHSNAHIHDQAETTMCGNAEYCSGPEPSNITYECPPPDTNCEKCGPAWQPEEFCHMSPLLVEISRFAPSGDLAVAAQVTPGPELDCDTAGEEAYPEDDENKEDCYHYINGDFQTNQAEHVVDGLYYVTGDVKLSGSALKDVDRTITIVAHGKIDISTGNLNITPYSSVKTPEGDQTKYVLISWLGGPGSCNTNAIKVSSSATHWTGIMYAPYGDVDVTGSANTSLLGGIWGYTVKLGGADLRLQWDPTQCLPGVAHDVFLVR